MGRSHIQMETLMIFKSSDEIELYYRSQNSGKLIYYIFRATSASRNSSLTIII